MSRVTAAAAAASYTPAPPSAMMRKGAYAVASNAVEAGHQSHDPDGDGEFDTDGDVETFTDAYIEYICNNGVDRSHAYMYSDMDWFNYSFRERGDVYPCVEALTKLYASTEALANMRAAAAASFDPASVHAATIRQTDSAAQGDALLVPRLALLDSDAIDTILTVCQEKTVYGRYGMYTVDPDRANLAQRIALLRPAPSAAASTVAVAGAMQRQAELAQLCAAAAAMDPVDMIARLKRMLAQVEKEVSDAKRRRP